MSPAPYSGAPASQTFMNRWRHGAARTPGGDRPAYVAQARPVCKVEVRRGEFRRSYHKRFPGPYRFGEIAGAGGRRWFPTWHALDAWTEIEGVKSVRLEQSFQNNGITSATIVFDNEVLAAADGVAGTYHVFERGFYSPLRGYVGPGRVGIPGIHKNSWYERLPNAQVRVKFGYGPDALTQSFLGLIDDLDLDKLPTITLTARDFGGVLVDQHIFGWVKDKGIPDPITFVPRHMAESKSLVGAAARASSTKPGSSPHNVVRGAVGGWQSDRRETANNLEWVEIHVPEGRYRGLYVKTGLPAQDLYIGVFARPRGKEKKLRCVWFPDAGTPGGIPLDASNMLVTEHQREPKTGILFPGGWVNFENRRTPETHDAVGPLADGGWPYFKRIKRFKQDKGTHIDFGGEFILGPNSCFRLGVSHMARTGERPIFPNHIVHRADVQALQAQRVQLTKKAKKAKWILTDDIVEIVEMMLAWGGFKSWEVEATGVDLKTPYVVDKSKSLMDVINEIATQVGYTFFIGEPATNLTMDVGNAIFRENRLVEPGQARFEHLHSYDRLLDFAPHWSNEQERSPIRARGHTLSKKKGGTTLGGDKVRRAHYIYRPPWEHRMAGVIKHLTHYDPAMTSNVDCQFACYLIALSIALSRFTGRAACPGSPTIGLDTIITLTDQQTAFNGRMYVSNRVQDFVAGENARYSLELGGALPDDPDVQKILRDMRAAAKRLDRNHKHKIKPRRPAHKHVPTNRTISGSGVIHVVKNPTTIPKPPIEGGGFTG